MNEITIGLALLGILFALLASGFWVAFTLLGVSIAGMVMLGNDNFGLLYSTSTWGAVSDWSLAALPLFIWMGEILFRTRLSKDLFEGLTPWLNSVPGRLLHVNILSCGIFAAVSGSSAATAATIGKMTLPELKRQGYDDKMAIATLAGSGTLGFAYSAFNYFNCVWRRCGSVDWSLIYGGRITRTDAGTDVYGLHRILVGKT